MDLVSLSLRELQCIIKNMAQFMGKLRNRLFSFNKWDTELIHLKQNLQWTYSISCLWRSEYDQEFVCERFSHGSTIVFIHLSTPS